MPVLHTSIMDENLAGTFPFNRTCGGIKHGGDDAIATDLSGSPQISFLRCLITSYR